VTEVLRARLAAGERLAGTVLTLPGAAIAELLAEPFDLVWIDLEHGALSRSAAQDLVIGAQAAGAAALVRVPARAHATMAAMLDAGADGVVLAAVDDAVTARSAVMAATHPPEGVRGYGPRRSATRHRGGGWSPPSIWVQIEARAGVANAAEIAAVAGIEAIVVGTADLSFSLDVPLDVRAPELLTAIEAVRHAAGAAQVAFGVAGALIDAPVQLVAGAQLLVHSTDGRLIASAADAAAAQLRALPPDARNDDTP
jgi:4-hydroxy-2-oxoheptanedioate aldolase